MSNKQLLYVARLWLALAAPVGIVSADEAQPQLAVYRWANQATNVIL